jgi:hypothetical protein
MTGPVRPFNFLTQIFIVIGFLGAQFAQVLWNQDLKPGVHTIRIEE